MENHLHKVEGMKDKVEPKKKIIREKTKNRGWRKKITNFLHKWFLRDSLTEDVSFYSLAEVQLVSSSYLQRFSGRISRRMVVQDPVILDTHDCVFFDAFFTHGHGCRRVSLFMKQRELFTVRSYFLCVLFNEATRAKHNFKKVVDG